MLIVRDAYQEGRYVFTAADLAARADAAGLVPKGDIAWYQAGTRLRPYGYPRVFVPNIAHQHILVLRTARRVRGRGLRREPAQAWPNWPCCSRYERRMSSKVPVRRAVVGGRPRVGAAGLDDDVAQGHLVQPALAPVRAQHPPVRPVLLEQDDLVALVERADLAAADLVRARRAG